MKVTRDGRRINVNVMPDGEGLVSHAGSALLAGVADKTGLTRALSREFGGVRQRRGRCDETGEALAGELRAGNAGANTAADQIAVAEHALEQTPAEHIETIELLLRVDSAGATHELLDCRRPSLDRARLCARGAGDPRPRAPGRDNFSRWGR